MTGYGRAGAERAGVAIACEIRSVNARGLDIRLRLPAGLERLEPELRRLLGTAFTRGAINLSLSVERRTAGGDVIVNPRALETVIAAITALNRRLDLAKSTPEAILALPGVLELSEARLDDAVEAEIDRAVLAVAGEAIAGLVTSRREEGARLLPVIAAHLDTIEALTAAAEAHPAGAREVVLERLRTQIADLLGTVGEIGEERLAQEALLLATKADIREELDRLSAHVAAARQLLAGGGAIGRKLDFLSQEFNREANTLCSKASAVELTAIGLDLKAAIDQLREQIQNIE
ncbi:YicC family protein [Arsenicitalea aurantiaca]|uniref:YicC family protein n=2 Tax=Arsenicitalea aurantiaca TaxID=1783274 RepID=A0A433X3I6_9HYPH|nr:YicC family protein [Arsenicitalea aurantiaca]